MKTHRKNVQKLQQHRTPGDTICDGSQSSGSNTEQSPFRKPNIPVVDEYAVRSEILKLQSEKLKAKDQEYKETLTELKKKKNFI